MTAPARSLWRVLPRAAAARALDPASAPEGRFHRDGQRSLYACLSPDGPAVSISRYLKPDDPARVILRLSLQGGTLFDAGSPEAMHAAGFDPAVTRHRWDLDRARGALPPTWKLSDRLRAAGFDGMIYPVRLRPDLRNIVLFRWNRAGAPRLACAGAPVPWAPAVPPAGRSSARTGDIA